jgi:hypothetical protein
VQPLLYPLSSSHSKKDNFKTQPIMMRTLLYAAILLPFYSSCTTNSAPSDVLTETEVKDFVAAYDQSWSTRDTLKLKELLDDNYIYFSSVGATSDKKESIAMFAPENNYKIDQSIRKEIKVILNGNTAVVNSHWIGHGSFKGTAFNDDQRCGIILKKTNNKISILSENCVQISQH